LTTGGPEKGEVLAGVKKKEEDSLSMKKSKKKGRKEERLQLT